MAAYEVVNGLLTGDIHLGGRHDLFSATAIRGDFVGMDTGQEAL
jgi:hypothetical protein